ncbi:MAG: hypothetical protein AAF485_05075 [Chloroflexota bacterium]
MKKLSLNELLKNSAAFTLVSGTTIDAGLLFVDLAGPVDIHNSWYLSAPVGIWALAGVPISINLVGRMFNQVNSQPQRITAFTEGSPSPLSRAIPIKAAAGSATLFTNTVQSIFSESVSDEPPVYRPTVWHVPIDDDDEDTVIVREAELHTFLDACWTRQNGRKSTFSRNYWVHTRRPPLPRRKYEAYLKLLSETGLIEGRQGGASGRMVTKAQHALTYLKYESALLAP